MKLENDFTVPASIDEAWAFLLDVPRVAPCLPGATVEPETDEDGTYKGAMKLKIGPITAQYKGTVKIQSADEATHTVAMRAQAKDARGQGSASATITSTMEETAEGTKVSVVTDMRVTGPAAQFGRGVMQDVSAKLMGRFADCLAEKLSGDKEEAPAEAAAPEAAAEETTAPGEVAESAPSASSGISSAEPDARGAQRVLRHLQRRSAEGDRGAPDRRRAGPRRGRRRRRAQARAPARRRRDRAARPHSSDPPLNPEIQRSSTRSRTTGRPRTRSRSSRRGWPTSPRRR